MSKLTKADKELLAHINETPSELVFWSFRYFLGRMTIAACAFAENLAKSWPYLDKNVQSLIMRELEHEFEQDDKAREDRAEKGDASMYKYSLPLGHACDREAWQKVRNAYWQQLPYDSYYRKQLRQRGLDIINGEVKKQNYA